MLIIGDLSSWLRALGITPSAPATRPGLDAMARPDIRAWPTGAFLALGLGMLTVEGSDLGGGQRVLAVGTGHRYTTLGSGLLEVIWRSCRCYHTLTAAE